MACAAILVSGMNAQESHEQYGRTHEPAHRSKLRIAGKTAANCAKERALPESCRPSAAAPGVPGSASRRSLARGLRQPCVSAGNIRLPVLHVLQRIAALVSRRFRGFRGPGQGGPPPVESCLSGILRANRPAGPAARDPDASCKLLILLATEPFARSSAPEGCHVEYSARLPA